jgi:uncharacterized phage protein (TIGR02220 family)
MTDPAKPPTPRYRRITVRMWGDARFLELSRPQPNGQSLWLYLITGPHTGIVPGLFVAGEAALAEALGWSLPAFRKAFHEITSRGMARVDRTTRLVFLPRAMVHNPPASPNVVRAWCQALRQELPECPLRDEAEAVLEGFVNGLGKGFQEAFAEGRHAPLPKPYPIQDQDQHQHQHQESLPIPPRGELLGSASGSPSGGQERTDPAHAWLAVLNEAVGTSFKPTKSTLAPIRARLAEGHRLEEAELVVRDLMRRWKGTDQDQYLRPSTLFGPKFAGYLEAAKRATANGTGHGPRQVATAWSGVPAGEVKL